MTQQDRQLDILIRQLEQRPKAEHCTLADLRSGMERFADLFPITDAGGVTPERLGGVTAERTRAGDAGIVLYLHGGGYAIGSPRSHRHLVERLATALSGEVWSLDYRLAPEAPFPAALDDACAAYEALSTRAGGPIAVAGDSAGGGLACALTIALLQKGAPAPLCLALFSPWVSLRTDAPSFDTLAHRDPLISRATATFFADHYAPAARHDDPLVSPLTGDFSGFPPTLIQAGGREVFLDDIRAFAQRLKAAGRSVDLQVEPEMFHVFQLYWPLLPEGRSALADAARFILEQQAACIAPSAGTAARTGAPPI